MGIHDRVDPYSCLVQLSELQPSQVLAGNYTSDDASSVTSEPPVVHRQPRRTRATKAEAIDYQSFAERLHCKSKRHAKRHNHLSMVKTLVGLEEAEIERDSAWAPDNYGRSIFSSLFAESEKMKAWNEFIEMNEEEQLLLIEENDTAEHVPDGGMPDISQLTLAESQFVEVISASDDNRIVHPSYSSQECFMQINQNMRNLLKKRHVPLGILESTELQLRAHFVDTPYSIYNAVMESSFGRLFVHAVSQYLGLESISFNDGEARVVTVVNKAATFNPPAQLLSEYLEWKAGRHQRM